VNWSRSFREANPSVPEARQFVAESLGSIPPEVRSTAMLLVSELATNAIVHATSTFEVTIAYPTPSGRVRIEVTDIDETQPAPLQPPPNVPHGRGLLLVASLADEWGILRRTGRPGKTVWFELALSIASAPAVAETGRRGSWFRRGLSLAVVPFTGCALRMGPRPMTP
jgi:anti-sigma regulatory factor (Ser/Thr protein kinase)